MVDRFKIGDCVRIIGECHLGEIGTIKSSAKEDEHSLDKIYYLVHLKDDNSARTIEKYEYNLALTNYDWGDGEN